MAINPFFNLHNANNKNTNEQALINGWAAESIQQLGMDVDYLPRTLRKEDNLYHEDVISAFTDKFTIEAYIESRDSFEGEGDMLANFGLVIKDQLNLEFAQIRFKEVFDGTGITRPMEGDLIHFPLSGSLFEIKFTEHESQFYPNGTLPTFKVRCELFDYSGEDFATGIQEVDNVEIELDAADSYADNMDIETEANAIMDFTEDNPWGHG